MVTKLYFASEILNGIRQKCKLEFEQEKHIHKKISNKRFIDRLGAESFLQLPFNIELCIVDCLFEDCTKNEISSLILFSRILKQKTPDTITLITKLSGSHVIKLSSKKGSWMLCHKLGHGLFCFDFGKNYRLGFFKNFLIKTKIEFLLQKCYNKFHKTTYTNYEKNIEGWDEVFKELSPFKSAQECIIIPDNDEYIYELVAQYSMFGKTRFLFPSQIFSNQTEAEEVSKTIDQLIFESLTNVVGEIIYGD